jgi:GTP:adenosylcobinamide-phosphate guanylyltransferase
MSQTYDVIIPAGGTLPADFRAATGLNYKALLPLQGQPILQRTISALRASGLVRRIAVIGSHEVLEEAKGLGADLLVPEGNSGPDNIFRGLDALLKESAFERLMIVTCDLPFLTPELIQKFVADCPPKDFCIPLIAEPTFNKRYPNAPATFVSLRDGTYTTGCIYLAQVEPLKNARPYIEKVFEQRKSKLGMAKLLGLGFVIKYLTKTMTVTDVEKKITDLLKCSGAAVRDSAPEFAYDIDYLEDYEYAVKHANEQHSQLSSSRT